MPIIGQVLTVRRSELAEALREFSIGFFLSILPLLVSALYGLIFVTKREWYFLVTESIRQGDLFIYSTGLLGPLFYIVQKSRAEASRFPHGTAFFFLSVALLLFSAIGYALIRANLVGTSSMPMNEVFVSNFSLGVFGTAVVMVFLCLAYKNRVESGAVDEVRQDEQNLTEALQRHRE